jgi:hypothetical protein
MHAMTAHFYLGPPCLLSPRGERARPLRCVRVAHCARRFKQATDIIGRIDTARLPALLTRVIGNLGSDTVRCEVAHGDQSPTCGAQDGDIFSEEEQEQIKNMFSLSSADLSTLVDASTYIFEQAAYHGSSEAALATGLQEAGLAVAAVSSVRSRKRSHQRHVGQSQAFAGVWRDNMAGYLDRLSARSLGAPQVRGPARAVLRRDPALTGTCADPRELVVAAADHDGPGEHIAHRRAARCFQPAPRQRDRQGAQRQALAPRAKMRDVVHSIALRAPLCEHVAMRWTQRVSHEVVSCRAHRVRML